MGSDEQAIGELHLTWIDAVNTGDLVGLFNSLADDVKFLGPGETPSSRDAFSSRLSAAHEQARINCIIELQDVVLVGEVAYALSRDTLSVTPGAGEGRCGSPDNRSTVYCKRPDSRWLLARDTPHVVTCGQVRGVRIRMSRSLDKEY